MEISPYNDTDRVWDTSKYHPKLSVITSRSRSFKVTRSRKGQTEIFGLGSVIHVFGSFFVKNAKMAIEHFLNGPSRTKFENQENTEIAGNGVKSGLFRSTKHQNSVNFIRYLPEISYTYTPDRVPSFIFRAFENSKIKLFLKK